MNSNGLIALILAAAIAAVIGYVITNQYQGWERVELGSLNAPKNVQPNIRTLVNRTDGVASNNYDSLDTPRGTTFTVPQGQQFVITKLNLDGISSGVTVEIGYGDTAVGDSGTPPLNNEVLWAQSLTGDVIETLNVWLVVPEGKIPYAQDGGNGWNLSVSGILQDPP